MNIVRRFLKQRINILNDFALNIIASVILTFATQIVVFPYIGKVMPIGDYGQVLTIMGMVYVLGVSLGNPLNNTRILLQTEYEKRSLNGDYNPIFIVLLIFNIFFMLIITTILYKSLNTSVIGLTIISSLVMFRSYYSAGFRLKIDYKKNLYASFYGLIGYFLGICVAYYTEMWIFIFIFGELITCVYIFLSVEIVRDRFAITELFTHSLRKYKYIMASAAISSILIYMDRFFIYPILGAEYVSIYNVASFLGKTAGVIMGPISAVLLTYYARESTISKKDIYIRTGISIIISFFFIVIIKFIGVPVTHFLYPTIAEYTKPYFFVSNLAAIVLILGNILQPILLRFSEDKWQLIIQGLYFLFYLVFGLIGMKNYGLIGFCYSILLVNILRFIFMFIVAILSLKQDE